MYREIGEMRVDRYYSDDVVEALEKAGYKISVIYDGLGDQRYHILIEENEE